MKPGYLKFFLPALFLGIGLMSCSEEKDPYTYNPGYEYYPLEVGQYLIYSVDSVVYDPVDNSIVIDTSSIFIKEEYVRMETSASGEEVYIIERSVRQNEEDPWQIADVWEVYNDGDKIVRTEENLSHIKMVFPLRRGQRWDGTAFFDKTIEVEIAGERMQIYKSWSSVTRVVGVVDTVGNFTFDKVVEIEHADDENAIELRYVQEKYAEGVGLVYREMKILDTQCIEPCLGQAWEEKAERGFILRQTIIDFN